MIAALVVVNNHWPSRNALKVQIGLEALHWLISNVLSLAILILFLQQISIPQFLKKSTIRCERPCAANAKLSSRAASDDATVIIQNTQTDR